MKGRELDDIADEEDLEVKEPPKIEKISRSEIDKILKEDEENEFESRVNEIIDLFSELSDETLYKLNEFLNESEKLDK